MYHGEYLTRNLTCSSASWRHLSAKKNEDHQENLRSVLEKLSKVGLRLRKEKCLFMEPEVIFCRYVINGNGVKPVADKVDAISNTPEPKGVSQLRAFLGMLNYYHRFLPDLSTVLEALHKLLWKEKKWRWGAGQREAYIALLGGIVGILWPNQGTYPSKRRF